ncbi:DUF2510 domain-containing protein [Nocardia sp. NBC_00508]|uniref:DUF2510 domain-containing protein n=1 Tax=Nocardia sp. NBC_00508 TaxID=2975992 RepID=UPI002E806096|nr:DUF2510 domain-containing protein [Nocardia sp. NBC_00508]WUD67313.1 DUF2510 domain-containing protein [Nocardia sp. NBC_00508]
MDPSPQLIEDLPSVTVLEMEFGFGTQLVKDLNSASHRFALSPIAWLTGQHRVPVIYDVNDTPAQAFEDLVRAFNGIRSTYGRWLIDAQAALTTAYHRKVNAGATSLVNRQSASPVTQGPKWLATNIVVPGLSASGFNVYFLPDQILVQLAKQFAAWRYCDLAVAVTPTRFIEGQAVPPDAVQVDHTWKYANKNGGPDRRFKNNRMLPILQYAELRINATGLSLCWQFSNVTAAEAFAAQLTNMPTLTAEEPAATTPRTIDNAHQDRAASVRGETDVSDPGQPVTLPARTPATVAPTTSPMPPPHAPPAWYLDPQGVARWRWWNGNAWTDYIA